MGSTQVGFKVCGSELRRSKDHKGKKVQNFKIQKVLILNVDFTEMEIVIRQVYFCFFSLIV